MLQIKRAGHSTLTTPDIERMIDYFTSIVGLSLAAREKNRAILATKSGSRPSCWSAAALSTRHGCRSRSRRAATWRDRRAAEKSGHQERTAKRHHARDRRGDLSRIRRARRWKSSPISTSRRTTRPSTA